jgi:hypothetical protein
VDGVRWGQDLIEAARQEGDELADATVDAVVADLGRAGALALLRTVIDTEDLPGDHPALAAYLAATGELPEPVDRARLATAESMFQAHGWTAFCLLGCASLPEGYVVPEIGKVLGSTLQLQQHVHRRLWETIQFTLDVMQPGGLEPGGPGIRSIQKVRLLHALVRRHLRDTASTEERAAGPATNLGAVLQRTPWDPAWGVPVNQAYMAGTVLAFSFIVLRGLERLGYDLVSEAEQEAYLYRWKLVGGLLGVRTDLLASTMAEADELFRAIRDPRMAKSAEGTALAAALVGFMEGRVPRWLPVAKPFPRLIITGVCDPATPPMLDIRLSRLEQAVARPTMRVMRWWGRSADDGLRHMPPVASAMRYLFRRTSRDMLDRPRGAERGEYTIPPALVEAWGI